ncbi:hypothetical protein IMCC20628_04747 (plasmid) [Hoeflea sp. IMCC20628]|uniref:hypothetical protein n=1 Tax=Hoeflea sp. IMCC20628 TaxID=1620421 RepID=UPI00063AC60B|nr:hypothetical protein [Hoeflea sp. IMCC20628]AKI03413.1 hypothetical protein IMCC20628_04747 [Hoeflea sp. IMCC20628]
MPKYEGMNSFSRIQRSLEQGPVPQMISDLAAGSITPVMSLAELQMLYRKDRISEAEAATLMTHACRAHALAVGSALVVTDKTGKICFGFVPDPGLEPDDAEMVPVFQALGRKIDIDHVANIVATRPKSDTRTSVECPVFVMPTFEYERSHGRAVEAFGTYLTSFRLPLTDRHG